MKRKLTTTTVALQFAEMQEIIGATEERDEKILVLLGAEEMPECLAEAIGEKLEALGAEIMRAQARGIEPS